MIKKERYEEENRNSRVDALAKALGLSWENGEYKREAVQRVSRAPRKAIIRRKRNPSFPEGVYESIKRLPVGTSLNITEHVRPGSLNRSQIANRIYMHMYTHGISKSHRYAVSNVGGVFAVTRI